MAKTVSTERFVTQFCQTYGECGLRSIKKNGRGYQIIYGNGSDARSVHIIYDRIFNPPEYAKKIAGILGLPKQSINF
jgi:hypothetical protein